MGLLLAGVFGLALTLAAFMQDSPVRRYAGLAAVLLIEVALVVLYSRTG